MRWLMMGYEPEEARVTALDQAGETIDVTDSGDSETWQSATRTQYDGIWVRWAEVDHAVRPLVQYRSMRPTTRIIIEIPDDLNPPNSELAQWVAVGIYDIVRSSTGTESVLRTVATIADVLSWTGFQPVDHGDQVGEGQAVKTKIEFRTVEKIVEKKIAASSRPVLIAVVGVAPGVGVTSTAVDMAKTLASMGHDVALTESANALPALSRWESELPSGITVFASPGPDPLELVRRREWPYIVVDGGAIQGWSEITPWQADLTILVGPGDRHRFSRWEPLVRSIPTAYTGAIVAGAVVGGGKDGPGVVEGLDEDGGLTAFVVTAEGKKGDRAMLAMLAPVLADGKGKPRRWWRKSYAPAVQDLPTAVNASPVAKADSDWKYTPSSPSAVPVYASPPPTPTVNVQLGRRSGGLGRTITQIMEVSMIWTVISLVAWAIVLANRDPNFAIATTWLTKAQWVLNLDAHLWDLVRRL